MSNSFSLSPVLGPSRRSVLATGLILTASLLTGVSKAQTREPVMTRAIPHSGEKLPVVGLGTAVSFPSADEAQRQALRGVIDALVAEGGKLIDTASVYGNAESVIGDIVEASKARERLFIATKIEVRSAKAGADEFERSLERLRTNKVDLLQLHNVSHANQSLAQLREWKAAGRCGYTGVTSTYPADYGAMEAIIRREKPDFVQVDYSMDNRGAEKRIIPVAADAGAAVLTALPLGHTSLFRAVKGKTLPDWAKEFDAATWGQFFLKFLLGNPQVTAVIPGTGNAEHMMDNLGAGRGRMPDAQQREKMAALLNS
jgi:aryl-alcohol dehydrogenase-like predicted oxidoreductase